MKKIECILFVFLLPLVTFAQQDPQYSQYMFNQLGINPGYAGSRDALSMNLFYRSQWTGFPGAPTTEVFNIHSPLKSNHMGLGLQVIGDQIGPVKTTSALATYAYKIKLGKGRLSFGLSAGMIDRVIDYTKINYKDPGDAAAGMGVVGKILPTFDFGLYYYTRNFYIGYSATHINQPAYGTLKDSATGVLGAVLKLHSFFTIGKAWVLSDNLTFRPSLLFKYVNGAPPSIDFDLSFLIRKKVWLGMTLRSAGALVGIIEYNVTDKLRIGYAYDLSFGATSVYAKSSHELFVGYDFTIFKSKTLSTRYF
jgi:type IX secretion system PorP/SprF family membrane protein